MFLPIVNIPIGEGPIEPVAVIYPTVTISWSTDVSLIVEELTNRRLPPSRILLVCPHGMHQPLRSAFTSDQDRLSDRLRVTTHVAIAPYNCHGKINADKVIDLASGDTPWVTDDLVKVAAADYLAQLTRKTNAVLQAPLGYRFRKPSGKTSDIFIRTGNMAREIDSLNVVSHMLLRHWPSSAKTIYVDSFTILSYALEFQKMISHFFHVSPVVENFHSYEIDDNFMFPVDDDYLVVISASTSNDLADKLVMHHKADRKRIIHILGAGHQDDGSSLRNSCLHFLDLKTPTIDATENIVVGGEEFIPSYSEPRVVQLTKDHVDGQIARQYKATFYKDYLRLKQGGSLMGYGSYSLFSTCNESGVLEDQVEEWLLNRLVHKIPASISLIVHRDDNMSRSIAERIRATAGFLADMGCLSLKELSAFDGLDLDESKSILIVAYEDPNLEQFTAAATTLRRWQEAHRHFVLAYGFPETKAGFDRLKRSLIRGHRPSYGWSQFSVSAVGRLDTHLSSLENYPLDLKESLEGNSNLDDGLLDALRCYANCSRRLFLPKLNGCRLTLRPGSVFFDGEYEQLTDEVVYLAVSAAVQRAREVDDLSPDLRFDSNPFIGSVLDPQMFSRYSDGILQAALLRCLHPSEMDFSGNTLLSRQVREVLIAVIKNSGNVVGEAALEFVAALVAGKIRVNTEDKEIIISVIKESSGDLAKIWDLFSEERPF